MNGRQRPKKVGRNDPCPCGSTKKYKKCHGASVSLQFSIHQEPMTEEVRRQFEMREASELQRQQQQGFGKPIISEEFQGFRFVAVAGRLFYSNKWKTFHDFLQEYIKTMLGVEWGNEELRKPPNERHPLLNWYENATRYQNQFVTNSSEVYVAPITGAVGAYLGVAYNLYLLAHNAKVQEILIRRLKNKDQFYGAHYETHVAGLLIKAGFEIDFEDESDGTTSHCELVATFRKTGRKFSVEAKMRGPNKTSVDVGNQLFGALKKRADHARVVFIEANVPDEGNAEKTLETLRKLLIGIRTREEKLKIDGNPAPPAYVFITNNPHEYSLNTTFNTWGMAEGFKIPDFHVDSRFASLREALNARERHIEVFSLIKSVREHSSIPSTFDGDNPGLAFKDKKSRLRIGEKYSIPEGQGNTIEGELVTATVSESEKAAIGALKMVDGSQFIAKFPLTEQEFAAYRKHPDTFFGTVIRHPKEINDPIEFYDFIHNTYRLTPKEKLLEFMNKAGDYEALKQLSQDELAKIYCERIVCQAFHNVKLAQNPFILSSLDRSSNQPTEAALGSEM